VRAYFTTMSGGLMLAENTSGWIPQALDSTKAVQRISGRGPQFDDGYRLRRRADGDRRKHGTALSVRGAMTRGTADRAASQGARNG
jgi:hypothetical protein